MLGVLVVTTGCVGLNPDYAAGEDTDGSTTDARTTTDGKDTKGGGSSGQDSGTSGGVTGATSGVGPTTDDPTNGNDTEPDPSTTGPKIFDVGDATTGGATYVNVMWISTAAPGNFASTDEVLCDAPPDASGASCADQPVVIVGTSETPLASLPNEHAFLGEGRLYAAGSGTVLAESYDALVQGVIATDFVHALTADTEQSELAVWWGPTDNMASSCMDWTAIKGTADLAVAVGTGMLLFEPGMCGLSHPVLCDCWGEP